MTAGRCPGDRRRGGGRASRVRGVVLCGVLPFALAAAALADEAAPEAPDTWYAASIARGDTRFLLTHYWAKDGRLRAETVAGGRRLITIVDSTTYYVIDPTRGEAVGIERSPVSIAGDALRARPFADELSAVLRAGGEKVGSEEINGVAVDRYQLTNDAGRIQVWVAPDRKLPVRVERYIRSAGAREKIEYINWLRGIPIADSFFDPPSDIAIERIGYEEYVTRSMAERVGPAPPFYSHLLHGDPTE